MRFSKGLMKYVVIPIAGCLAIIACMAMPVHALPEAENQQGEAAPDLSGPWELQAGSVLVERSGHTSVVLPDGTILIMGGYGEDGYLNDIWRSVDGGDTWFLVTEQAEWPGRSGHTSVVLADGEIVLMGGITEGGIRKNDVWHSTDAGVSWSLLTDAALWSPRYAHTSVVLPEDGSIVLMGGNIGIYLENHAHDVWRSDDGGETWQEQTHLAEWRGRYDHASVALSDDSILVIAGKIKGYVKINGVKQSEYTLTDNSVYISTDQGQTWEARTGLPRSVGGHSSVVLSDDGVVVMGGHYYSPFDGGQSIYRDNVWRSDDAGLTWNELTNDPGWLGRNNHTGVALADDTIVLMGGYNGNNWNDVWRSSDQGPSWENIACAEWSQRSGSSSVVLLDGSILLMGGTDGSTWNDVWRSTNKGKTWQLMVEEAEWMGRYGHTSVVLPDGSIILMGGLTTDGYIRLNDVWRSEDKGESWTQMTGSAEWTGRNFHTSVALSDGSIVLMGGYTYDGGFTRINDVWRSIDKGATWTQMTANAEWLGREDHTSVALADDTIVLMGGADGYESEDRFNDVWMSTDKGKTWTELTSDADWVTRGGHSSVVLSDDTIVLMGGIGGLDNDRLNDVWFSTDQGITWNLANINAEWSGRNSHTSVALPDDSILLMGGYDGSRFNDVWRLPTGPDETFIFLPMLLR